MDERMTREEIKEYIFDDLVEFLEQTGTTNTVTPEEIADLLEETPARVKGCMQELVQEGVLDRVKVNGEWQFQLAEDSLDDLIAEMREQGWEPPDLEWTDPFDDEA